MRRLAILAAVALAVLSLTARGEEDSGVGVKIGEFKLQDHLGARRSLSEWRERKAVVVAFLGVECPLAKLYGPRLAELSRKYEPQGVQFLGINANQQDTLREIAHYVGVHQISFPVLKDPGAATADRFGARRTPEVFVLDERRVVRYRGRIDNQYGVGYARTEATQCDLAIALDELLSGRPISTPRTESVGCYIGRPQEKASTGDITYSQQISRLMQKHCVSCHRPGQIAPFALTSYAEVSAWAETMREVIAEGRMPPWHANPEHGEFANEATMSDAEKQLFDQWVENGVPEGDPTLLPDPLEFVEGWRIPEPDVVFRMPEAFTVPATGVVPYQYFTIDPGFEDDVWIQGAEVRPGNAAVVHHASVFYLPPGQSEPRVEDPLFNLVAGFAPGSPAGLWPEGHARFVPAGSKLVFQMHYTPNGREQADQSEVGLVFAESGWAPKEIKFGVAVNTNFRIPPGAANHRVDAGYQFTQDTLLHVLIPHMHYRGKSFRFTARYPDGREAILLDVPRYDFNWQNAYLLDSPLRMPTGTVLMCAGHFDNSPDNPMNPDPTQEVRWGDQTWEEMMLGTFVISLPESAVAGEYPKIAHVRDDEFEVAFRYRPEKGRAGVEAVFLAGTFNDWKSDAHKMDGPDQEGCFRTTLRLKPGQYEYKFVLNGADWTHDPENPNRTGPFTNSVFRVRRERER
jgi:peroxiredoxin